MSNFNPEELHQSLINQAVNHSTQALNLDGIAIRTLERKKPLLPLQIGFVVSVIAEAIIFNFSKDLPNLNLITQAILGLIPAGLGAIGSIIRSHSTDGLLNQANQFSKIARVKFSQASSLSPEGERHKNAKNN